MDWYNPTRRAPLAADAPSLDKLKELVPMPEAARTDLRARIDWLERMADKAMAQADAAPLHGPEWAELSRSLKGEAGRERMREGELAMATAMREKDAVKAKAAMERMREATNAEWEEIKESTRRAYTMAGATDAEFEAAWPQIKDMLLAERVQRAKAEARQQVLGMWRLGNDVAGRGQNPPPAA
jgi:hypothetical protein